MSYELNDKKKLNIFVILVAAIVTFFAAFFNISVSFALPAISKTFGLANIFQNWVSQIFLLTIAVFSIPAGFIVGKYGIKKCMIVGVVLSLISCIGCLLAPSAGVLFFFRVVTGIGFSLMNVSATLFIAEPLPKEKRGKAFGIYVASVYAGLASAYPISGVLIRIFGWEGIFYLSIPVFIFILLLLIFAIDRDWIISENTSFDLRGFVVYAIGIVLFTFGVSGVKILNKLIKGIPSVINGTTLAIILTVLGLICLVCFAVYELKVSSPIFKTELFKGLEFSAAIFTSLIGYTATYIIGCYVLNYHFQYVFKYSPQDAGFILALPYVLQAVVSVIAGRLTDKINPLKLSSIALSFVSVALIILFTTLGPNTPLYLILIAMGLHGIGWGLFSPSNVTAIMSSVPEEDTNHASSALSTVRCIGETLSLGIYNVILLVVMGVVAITPSNRSSLISSSRVFCVISFILCIIALVVSFIGYKRGTKL